SGHRYATRCKARYSMKSNAALMKMLLLAIVSAPGLARSQSATAMVAGRVTGLPSENVANFELVFVRDTAPCAVLRTHTRADGSFRLSSVRGGDYRVAVSGIPQGYGIKTMTAGGLDLLSNSVRLVAFTQTQVLIEVAQVEDLRRQKSSVVRVGDDLRSFCVIHKVQPIYPSQTKAAQIVGNVILSIRFDENGYVNDIRVIEGHPLLTQSAVHAVRQWRYAPFVFQGTIIPGITTVVLPFGLKWSAWSDRSLAVYAASYPNLFFPVPTETRAVSSKLGLSISEHAAPIAIVYVLAGIGQPAGEVY